MATELESSPGSNAAVDSSHLRVRMKPAASAAARRVANYLRALGLSDRARVPSRQDEALLGRVRSRSVSRAFSFLMTDGTPPASINSSRP